MPKVTLPSGKVKHFPYTKVGEAKARQAVVNPVSKIGVGAGKGQGLAHRSAMGVKMGVGRRAATQAKKKGLMMRVR